MRRHRIILPLVALFSFCLSQGFAAEPAPGLPGAISARDSVTLRMVQLAQTGHIPEARAALRDYLDRHPGDGTMLYNLACFDVALSDAEQALVDLEAAFQAGYTNFRHMENDLSLKGIREDPRYISLFETYESRFREVFASRALVLEEGYPLEEIPLRPGMSDQPAPDGPEAAISLSYDRDGIRLDLRVDDPAFDASRPFWDGGSGLLFNLILPITPEDYESRRYFSLGFGYDPSRKAVGALLVARHGDNLMIPVTDLQPAFIQQGDRIAFGIDLPWSLFRPYAPPLDPRLGLNVFYLGAGPGDDRPVLSLMPESRLSYGPNPWRRYVPLDFLESDRSEPVMRGRLYDRLVESGVVEIQLALWALEAGDGRIELRVLESGDRPTDAAPVIETFVCEEELNLLNQAVEIGDLEPAAYVLSVICRQPDGSVFTDRFPFTNLRADWIAGMNERIHRIDGPEKELLTYRIHALSRDLDKRHSQDPAANFVDHFRNLEALIALRETRGSCLPGSGSFQGGFYGQDNTQRFCELYLPYGWKASDVRRLAVVIPPAPGSEKMLAAAVGHALRSYPDLIVMVPQSHGFTGLKTGTSVRHTLLAIDWGRALFETDDVLLVGLGHGAEAALETALSRPDHLRWILLETARLSRERDGLAPPAAGDGSAPHAFGPAFTLAATHPDSAFAAAVGAELSDRGSTVERLWLPDDARDADWVSRWLLENGTRR